jgi:hypothetical protein
VPWKVLILYDADADDTVKKMMVLIILLAIL